MSPVRTQEATNIYLASEASTDCPTLTKPRKLSEVLTG